MASIFRRIYDWLLRLFWYVCLCALPLHVRLARCLMGPLISGPSIALRCRGPANMSSNTTRHQD